MCVSMVRIFKLTSYVSSNVTNDFCSKYPYERLLLVNFK